MRQHCFGTLPLLGDPRMNKNRAGRIESHGGAVLRGDSRAADAVKRRRRIGHFDEGRKADAAMHAVFAQPRLLGA